MLTKKMFEVPNYPRISYTYTVCGSHFLEEAPRSVRANIAKTKAKANYKYDTAVLHVIINL